MRSARLGTLAAAAAVLIAGCDSARPIEQRTEVAACERCHGFPPPAPHPQSTACQVCHSTTVVSGTELVPGGAHGNGRVDLAAHPMPYAAHPVDALTGGLGACTVCHGDLGGTGPKSCNGCHGTIGFADWKTNCTFCHGQRTAGWTPAELPLAAPPEAVLRSNNVDGYRGIGAHQGHVNADTFASPITCTECHPTVSDLAHIDQSVAVQFGPLASNGMPAGATWDVTVTSCTNYCHGATLPKPETRTAPVWSPVSVVACGSCHEASPTTGRHPAVTLPHASFGCGLCHGGTYTPAVVDEALHLNAALDVSTSGAIGWNPVARTCTNSCHLVSPTRGW